MSLQRVNRFTIVCDSCREEDTEEDVIDFTNAGWQQITTDGDTIHLCPTCASEDHTITAESAE